MRAHRFETAGPIRRLQDGPTGDSILDTHCNQRIVVNNQNRWHAAAPYVDGTDRPSVARSPSGWYNGNSTQNVLPAPSWLITPMSPCIARVSSWQMARPSPVPLPSSRIIGEKM